MKALLQNPIGIALVVGVAALATGLAAVALESDFLGLALLWFVLLVVGMFVMMQLMFLHVEVSHKTGK